MSSAFRSAGMALALISAPIAAHAQVSSGAAAGALGGAAAGALVGGPIGALVGGMAGAAMGSGLPEEASSPLPSVIRQGLPSERAGDGVPVGGAIARHVRLHRVPAELGAPSWYRYTVVNGRTVFVDGRTRKVVQVIR